jgi:hypothetical protein
MSVSSEALAGQERVELASVRLRQPERHQMAMVVSCPDDLVSATHPVRLLQAVVERLDLKQFYEPIQARQGVAGRDATGSSVAGGAVAVCLHVRHRLGPRTGAPMRWRNAAQARASRAKRSTSVSHA